ncbi:MAG: twin-arginine translocation signal domain-containing protein, partial [Planctomycetota bacterium]
MQSRRPASGLSPRPAASHRRGFLQQTGAVAAAGALVSGAMRRVHAAGDDVL